VDLFFLELFLAMIKNSLDNRREARYSQDRMHHQEWLGMILAVGHLK
jgi:hypothetical protein